jgi:UDP-N-acetylmuramoyl-L-alanyl-D-glutamate--2,6-diaminopimelate ligase
MTKGHGQHGPRPRLHELAEGLETLRVLNDADPAIAALANDSRRVVPGALFVAVKGERADGHLYIAQAVERGAAAVVCQQLPPALPACPVIQVADSRRALSILADRYFGSPSRKLRVTGITGTEGKTSTTELLRLMLTQAGHPAGSIGTLGCCFGDRWTETDLTTPDAIVLHETLSQMLQAGLTDACMEVSSHSLAMHRVADVDFDAAVLTNITHDHLDYHGTREDYALAKRKLFEGLDGDAVAVLPAESEFCEPFRNATHAPVLTYGMHGPADVTGSILSLGMDGMELEIRTPFEKYRASTCLIGTYNCLNILAAVTAALGRGVGAEAVQEALRGLRGVPGRLERVSVPGRPDLPAVCVDFAHTPEALRKVLTTLRPLVRGKLVCVVGCGGDRDRTKRPLMGRIAAECADVAVFTADNSRSERTEDIIAQIVAGVTSPAANHRVEPDRARAIELALRLAGSPDSLVAVCGRGCERHLKMADCNIAFDDRAVAREIMQRMPERRRRIA